MATASGLVKPEEYRCAICWNTFKRPVRLGCKHLFCSGCIESQSSCDGERKCAVCRSDITKVRPAPDVERAMSGARTQCGTCKTPMTILEYRSHHTDCDSPLGGVAVANPSASSTSMNRQTFTCPLCNAPNLDAIDLTKHCIQQHVDQKNVQAVCPVCASMPWGDPNKTSKDFVGHMKLRHRFEYEYFADFEMTDDQMIELAVKASLTAE